MMRRRVSVLERRVTRCVTVALQQSQILYTATGLALLPTSVIRRAYKRQSFWIYELSYQSHIQYIVHLLPGRRFESLQRPYNHPKAQSRLGKQDMVDKETVPCAIFGQRNRCRATTLGDKLCDLCHDVHPAATHIWRRAHPELDFLFKEIDEFNEKPETCVVRRKRYVDSQMAKDVLEDWKSSPHLHDRDNPCIIICKKTEKADTVCKHCQDVMSGHVFGKYFREDGTVKEV